MPGAVATYTVTTPDRVTRSTNAFWRRTSMSDCSFCEACRTCGSTATLSCLAGDGSLCPSLSAEAAAALDDEATAGRVAAGCSLTLGSGVAMAVFVGSAVLATKFRAHDLHTRRGKELENLNLWGCQSLASSGTSALHTHARPNTESLARFLGRMPRHTFGPTLRWILVSEFDEVPAAQGVPAQAPL
eukprot:1571593-Rhodomonas_salina.2